MKWLICFISIILVILFAILFFLVFLIPGSNTDVSETKMDYRITCILPSNSGVVFWREIDENMQEASENLNVEITTIYTYSSEDNMLIDVNQAIEIAILSRTQAIIMTYSRADEDTETLLKKARENGIYVVLIDCDSPEDIRDVYVGIDNDAAGYALGQDILQSLEDGKIALLPYTVRNTGYQNLADRIAGIERAFSLSPEKLQKVEIDNWDDIQSPISFEKDYLDNDNVGAMIAIHEKFTISFAQLLERTSLTESVNLYGFDESDDTMELLQNGKIKALLCQNHKRMGYKSIQAAVDLIQDVNFTKDKYMIDFIVEE